MSSQILKPIPLEEWTLLAESLKNEWPTNAQYYYFIQTAVKWKSKEPNLPITIYCPNGNYNSGVFVGISSCALYFTVVFAHEGLEDLLYKAVTETEIIKWNEGVFFAAVHARLIPTVYSIIEFMKIKRGIEIEFNNLGHCFFKSKEECAVVDIQLPEDCYLKELDETHVPLVHSVWPHRNEEHPELTMKQVSAMVKFNGGLGLFLKKNNELVSWAIHSETGAISLVQTIERCKRRGYAKIVTNAFAKQLADKGIDSFVFIVKENRLSESMFLSLNFKRVHQTDWIQMSREVDNK